MTLVPATRENKEYMSMNTTNKMNNNNNNNNIEEYVSELVSIAKKVYASLTNNEPIWYSLFTSVVALFVHPDGRSPPSYGRSPLRAINATNDNKEVKRVFAMAQYRVSSLPLAPVASRLEDMPDGFTIDYIEAISRANTAVYVLKKKTNDLDQKCFNIDDITSAAPSASIEGIDSRDSTSNKRDKVDKCEVVKNKLKIVCDSYDKARQILVREMQKYEKLMETMMADAVADEDEVLFNVRGELVTASRSSLINTTTNRTYFDGLLTGGWKSDVIGMHAISL
jgi:hypothetical protein